MRLLTLTIFLWLGFTFVKADDVLGCGGFIKSHVPIDFSKIIVKLYTKQGILKDQTNCAPNNGYYFIPLYDKGDYVLQLEPPPGWSFTPINFSVAVNGKNDVCTQGKDINFTFKGFGITGKVESFGNNNGPAGVEVELKSNLEIRKTITGPNGVFSFTPVFPGNYKISVQHERWNLFKPTLSVVVTEGNTELPPQSLVIGGYEVSGSVTSDGEPIRGVKILIYSKENKKSNVQGCERPTNQNEKFLCYVISDSNGNFIFPTVSNGNYYIVPSYKDHKVHFEPSKIDFSISHDSVKLTQEFEIVGFSISGKVLNSYEGLPLSGAHIFINSKKVALTDSNGYYSLEKMKLGTYTIQAMSENYKFEPKMVKINPNFNELPAIYPSFYKACGVIIGDKIESKLVRITGIEKIVTKSDPNTGEFCEFLKPGKYKVEVNLDDGDDSLQFFPSFQMIEIKSKPIYDITFSQLKAVVTGKIECQACSDINIIFEPSFNSQIDRRTTIVVNGSYTFYDVKPGTYKVYLTQNRLCWKDDEHTITITTALYNVPDFKQTGYSVTFVSSHETKVAYKNPGEENQNILSIEQGISKHCLQKSGNYVFNLVSCHIYPSDSIEYSTDQGEEVLLRAQKHRAIVSINAKQDFGNIFVSINTDGTKQKEGPLSYDGNYKFNMDLSPGETAILVPQSDIVYFNPPIASITGEDNCVDFGVQFEAMKGKVFKGRINPPLQGVQITVESDNSDTLLDETDSDGYYKFPPLDDSKSYQITAKKDSYILIGPDENGNFLAHKLAEIIVQVVDQKDGSPLQGALLSLSGGESYRSNLQTNEEGKITFSGLGPSQYFLRPMMKEYSFLPPSKIIDVKVGASVKVQLMGNRVAYSAYGQVTSLNNQPEDKMIVEATGTNNCSQFSEEATTEPNGSFRIRGLQPYCSYEIKVKGSIDEKDVIERAIPDAIEVSQLTQDFANIHLIIFRPVTSTNVLVRINTENPDHYKNLRVKISRESAPAGLVHNFKVDTSTYKIPTEYNAGILVQMPPVPLDGKMYTVQLESTVVALNKEKPQIKVFTADGSFKFVDLNFVVKSNVTDQNIKQTSVWALVFVFGFVGAILNINKISEFFKAKVPQAAIETPWKAKTTIHHDFIEDDIDQIVDSINPPKRKIKAKRI